MTALIQDKPVDYYELWKSYRAGIQPTIGEESQQPDLPVFQPKGMTQLFPRDVLVAHLNANMASIISKYSLPSRGMLQVSNPADEKFVSIRRISAHLMPLSLSVY